MKKEKISDGEESPHVATWKVIDAYKIHGDSRWENISPGITISRKELDPCILETIDSTKGKIFRGINTAEEDETLGFAA